MWQRWHLHKPISRFLGSKKLQAIICASITLIIVAYTLIKGNDPSSEYGNLAPKWASFQTSVQFHPSLEFLNGTEVIWQIPDSPKAALFIAHGCGVRASYFWDNYPGCTNCIGLPEERLLVLNAIQRKFAVLTISSLGKCWSFDEEMENVQWIIKWWVEKNKLGNLPIVALGASSGGYFISVLATRMKFSSIAIMIAEGVVDVMAIANNYPPTLFVHMPKDKDRTRFILMVMKNLRQKGVPVKEIRCMDFPLTPNLFSDMIPGINHTLSVKLFDLFHEKLFIDGNDYMKKDGRATNWKEAVTERKLLPSNFELFHHIEEELNVAFAYHEMTSLQSDEIFEWFKSHMNR